MKTKILKLISVVMAFSFFLNSSCFGVPDNSIGSVKPQLVDFPLPDKIDNIFVPESYGTVERVLWTSLDKQVILIKDAHCNYEAQTNISKILDVLIRDYKIDLVCVEGAEGRVDTKPFSAFPDKEAKNKVTDKYIKKGLLTASEALSISKGDKQPFTIWGVEDSLVYLEDFRAFRETLIDSAGNISLADQLIQAAGVLKDRIYNPRLLEFDRKYREYEENKIKLSDWMVYLRSWIMGLGPYKNIVLVVKSIKLEEEIDFKGVERERTSLIKELEKLLPKEEIKELVKKSLLFKLGKISSASYYTYLKEITPDSFQGPNLNKYTRLVKIQSLIDSDELFKELSSLESSIYAKLCRTELERKLHKIDINLVALNKLFHLQMSREDLDYYKAHINEFDLKKIKDFINIQCRSRGLAATDVEVPKEEFLQSAETFYELALKRDEILVDNLLEKMDRDKKQRAAMIIGGFHAEGIIRKLEEEGISYTVVSPRITELQEDNPYLSIMLNDQIDIDKMIEDISATTLSTYLLFGNMGDIDPGLAQEARRRLARDLIAYRKVPLAKLVEKYTLENIEGYMLKELCQIADISDEEIGKILKRETKIEEIEKLKRFLEPDALADRIIAEQNTAFTAFLLELLKEQREENPEQVKAVLEKVFQKEIAPVEEEIAREKIDIVRDAMREDVAALDKGIDRAHIKALMNRRKEESLRRLEMKERTGSIDSAISALCDEAEELIGMQEDPEMKKQAAILIMFIFHILLLQDEADLKLPFVPHSIRHSLNVRGGVKEVIENSPTVREYMGRAYGSEKKGKMIALLTAWLHDIGYSIFNDAEIKATELAGRLGIEGYKTGKGYHANLGVPMANANLTDNMTILKLMDSLFGLSEMEGRALGSKNALEDIAITIRNHGAYYEEIKQDGLRGTGKNKYRPASLETDILVFLVRLSDNMDLDANRRLYSHHNNPFFIDFLRSLSLEEQGDIIGTIKREFVASLDIYEKAYSLYLQKNQNLGNDEADQKAKDDFAIIIENIKVFDNSNFPHFAGMIKSHRVTEEDGRLVIRVTLNTGNRIIPKDVLDYQVKRMRRAFKSLTFAENQKIEIEIESPDEITEEPLSMPEKLKKLEDAIDRLPEGDRQRLLLEAVFEYARRNPDLIESEESFEEGREIIKEGFVSQENLAKEESLKYVYILIDGELEVYQYGQEEPLAKIDKPGLFGEMMVLMGKRTASVKGAKSGEMLKITRDKFLELLQDPQFVVEYAKLVRERERQQKVATHEIKLGGDEKESSGQGGEVHMESMKIPEELMTEHYIEEGLTVEYEENEYVLKSDDIEDIMGRAHELARGKKEGDKIVIELFKGIEIVYRILKVNGRKFFVQEEILEKIGAGDTEEGEAIFAIKLLSILQQDELEELPRGRPFLITTLKRSQRLFEDHVGNGFIGINEAFFKLWEETMALDDEALSGYIHSLLELGLEHELRHEAGIESEDTQREIDIRCITKNLGEDVERFLDFLNKRGVIDIEFKDEVLRHKIQEPSFPGSEVVSGVSTISDSAYTLGDIHADFDALIEILQGAGLIKEEKGEWVWSGGEKTLVQLGDIVDRGPKPIETMDFLLKLQAQAREAGGRVVLLLGNHELGYIKKPKKDLRKGKGDVFTGIELNRYGELRRKILENVRNGNIQAAYHISDTLFVHAGVKMDLYRNIAASKGKVDVSVEEIAEYCNHTLSEAVSSGDFSNPIFGIGEDGIGFSDDAGICWARFNPISAAGVLPPFRQMVGHMPVESSVEEREIVKLEDKRTGGKVIFMDLGASREYGGGRGFMRIDPRGTFHPVEKRWGGRWRERGRWIWKWKWGIFDQTGDLRREDGPGAHMESMQVPEGTRDGHSKETKSYKAGEPEVAGCPAKNEDVDHIIREIFRQDRDPGRPRIRGGFRADESMSIRNEFTWDPIEFAKSDSDILSEAFGEITDNLQAILDTIEAAKDDLRAHIRNLRERLGVTPPSNRQTIVLERNISLLQDLIDDPEKALKERLASIYVLILEDMDFLVFNDPDKYWVGHSSTTRNAIYIPGQMYERLRNSKQALAAFLIDELIDSMVGEHREVSDALIRLMDPAGQLDKRVREAAQKNQSDVVRLAEKVSGSVNKNHIKEALGVLEGALEGGVISPTSLPAVLRMVYENMDSKYISTFGLVLSGKKYLKDMINSLLIGPAERDGRVIIPRVSDPADNRLIELLILIRYPYAFPIEGWVDLKRELLAYVYDGRVEEMVLWIEEKIVKGIGKPEEVKRYMALVLSELAPSKHRMADTTDFIYKVLAMSFMKDIFSVDEYLELVIHITAKLEEIGPGEVKKLLRRMAHPVIGRLMLAKDRNRRLYKRFKDLGLFSKKGKRIMKEYFAYKAEFHIREEQIELGQEYTPQALRQIGYRVGYEREDFISELVSHLNGKDVLKRNLKGLPANFNWSALNQAEINVSHLHTSGHTLVSLIEVNVGGKPYRFVHKRGFGYFDTSVLSDVYNLYQELNRESPIAGAVLSRQNGEWMTPVTKDRDLMGYHRTEEALPGLTLSGAHKSLHKLFGVGTKDSKEYEIAEAMTVAGYYILLKYVAKGRWFIGDASHDNVMLVLTKDGLTVRVLDIEARIGLPGMSDEELDEMFKVLLENRRFQGDVIDKGIILADEYMRQGRFDFQKAGLDYGDALVRLDMIIRRDTPIPIQDISEDAGDITRIRAVERHAGFLWIPRELAQTGVSRTGLVNFEELRVGEDVEYDGTKARGKLFMRGVDGLEAEEDEVERARLIKDHIQRNGRPIKKGLGLDGKVCGRIKEDSELNAILEDNLEELFEGLPREESEKLLGTFPKGLVFAILDQSYHFGENCRGDGFVGVNRYLLVKLRDAKEKDEIDALSNLLQVILYHELRHEALIFEREVLLEKFEGRFDDLSTREQVLEALERLSPVHYRAVMGEVEFRQNLVDIELLDSRGVDILINLKLLRPDSYFTASTRDTQRREGLKELSERLYDAHEPRVDTEWSRASEAPVSARDISRELDLVVRDIAKILKRHGIELSDPRRERLKEIIKDAYRSKDKTINLSKLIETLAEKIGPEKIFQLAAEIAEPLNRFLGADASTKGGRIVAAVLEEIWKLIPGEKRERGITAEERLINTMRALVEEECEERDIDPNAIWSVLDLFKAGVEILRLDPDAKIDANYIELIELIEKLTGIDDKKIIEAFTDRELLKERAESVANSPLAQEVQKLEKYLELNNIRTRGDLDLEYGLSREEKELFNLDILKAKVKRGDAGDVQFLSGVDTINKDLADAYGEVRSGPAGGLVDRTDPVTLVISDDVMIDYERDGKVVEFSYKPGINALLKTVASSKNIHIVIRASGTAKRIIEKSGMLLNEQITVVDKKKSLVDIRADADLDGRAKDKDHVAFLVTPEEGEQYPDDQLKVFGLTPEAAFHAALLFGVIYARAQGMDEIKTAINCLETLGMSRLEVDEILRKIEEKGLTFFVIKPIRIEDTLRRLQNCRLYIEVAA